MVRAINIDSQPGLSPALSVTFSSNTSWQGRRHRIPRASREVGFADLPRAQKA